jgi:hypothetical protein
MGKLRQKQVEFMKMLPRLIDKAFELGYEVTGGDLFRDSRCCYGSSRSKHRQRLAIDLNLFKDGIWLTKGIDHKPLGEWWESKGGQWGGRFGESKKGAGDGWDGNHYQWPIN